jgi:CubicO group peptidase (beta-lactamase class C family)
MRALVIAFVLASCSSPSTTPVRQPDPGPVEPDLPPSIKPTEPAPAAAPTERLTADTPKTTVLGNTFIAPAGWTITVRGAATILGAPEGDSWLALVDVRAKDADAAIAAGWAAYKPEAKWPLKVATDAPASDGWTDRRVYEYIVSPNEKRVVRAGTRRANDVWTVAIFDMAEAVADKRRGQLALIFGRLFPNGYARESFAGKRAHELDVTRIGELGKFVEAGQQALGVPGVSVGIIQNGKVVFSGGFGARQLGKPAKPDGNTMFMVASNTKALTTLLLAKLVEAKKLTWDTQVTTLLPKFALGDDATTKSVMVKHLICACTGLPRQDFEWLFQFKGVTPESALATLGTMQPTSKFGEMFQYSNPLAAAAGFVGGHVMYPKLELGAAYDKAMQSQVFDPLGMKVTTFDYKRAQRGNYSAPHSQTIDGKPAVASMDLNYSIIPVRPAGAAWSNVNDMLKYVAMELADGALPNGKRYIDKDTLLARRAPQVPIGKDTIYGMGLTVDTKYGTPLVHHGGDMIGFHSDMLWLPEHGVGAVILTNGDPGWVLRSAFSRKLLEVLFDGKPEADADVAAAAKSFFEQLAADRKLLVVPADPGEAGKLAAKYKNASLGDITVRKAGVATVFDFGEWKSEVASRKNPDGSISFITIAPGYSGFEFVVGTGAKRTLVTRDAQHEYVFDE